MRRQRPNVQRMELLGTEVRPVQAGTRTLKEATERMKRSAIARELFGEAFVDHFVRTREWEWRQFLDAVTDWEIRRYVEII